MVELTFILQKGEKIIGEAERCQYAGVEYINIGSGIGATSSNTGLGGALFSTKQQKREGSFWDVKNVHIYLTNKRIIICNAKISLFGGKEKSIGTLLSEINYKNIKGINSSSKLMSPVIDIAVAGTNGIDNIKFWFLGSEEKRGKERDEFMKLIKKQL